MTAINHRICHEIQNKCIVTCKRWSLVSLSVDLKPLWCFLPNENFDHSVVEIHGTHVWSQLLSYLYGKDVPSWSAKSALSILISLSLSGRTSVKRQHWRWWFQSSVPRKVRWEIGGTFIIIRIFHTPHSSFSIQPGGMDVMSALFIAGKMLMACENWVQMCVEILGEWCVVDCRVCGVWWWVERWSKRKKENI